MSDNESQLLEKLKDMAKLSILSNRINSIQEKNLKMFPFILFEDVKSVKIDFDLSRTKTVLDEPEKSNSIVSYYLTLEEKTNQDNLEKRFATLEASVRKLFWSDVTVEVYFNEKIVYKSKRNERK